VLVQQDTTGEPQPEPDARGVVVGVPTDSYWRPFDPVIADAVDAAADRLAEAGAKLVKVDTPGVDELPDVYGSIVCAEAYATHAADLAARPEEFQPIIAKRMLANADLPATEYVDAQRARRRFTTALRAHLSTVDVLLTATTPLRATPIGQDEVDGVRVGLALLSLTLPFNLTGLPAVSVPMPPSDGGLPAGVQLVGIRSDEHALLRVAAPVQG
jgi:Asp-tRNA(Asn)/Glu-tRNA(Gln) amidotransferase A subunit family amidase